MNKNVLGEKSFSFAIKVVKLTKWLMEEKKEYIMSRQLCKSGTAIGALYREAQNAESKPDFIHKLGISQKEADESIYWLDLLFATEYINKSTHNELISECTELLKMIKSSILTSKEKLNKKIVVSTVIIVIVSFISYLYI